MGNSWGLLRRPRLCELAMLCPTFARGASPSVALSEEILLLPFSREVNFSYQVYPDNPDHQISHSPSVRYRYLSNSWGLLSRPR